MSLYNHVADKEDILHGGRRDRHGRVRVPDDHDDCREAARRAARAWWALLKAHPNDMTLMSHQRKPMTLAVALRPTEHSIEILERAGLSGAETVRAFHAFGGYVQGFVLAEIAPMFDGEDSDGVPDDVMRTIQLEELPPWPPTSSTRSIATWTPTSSTGWTS